MSINRLSLIIQKDSIMVKIYSLIALATLALTGPSIASEEIAVDDNPALTKRSKQEIEQFDARLSAFFDVPRRGAVRLKSLQVNYGESNWDLQLDENSDHKRLALTPDRNTIPIVCQAPLTAHVTFSRIKAITGFETRKSDQEEEQEVIERQCFELTLWPRGEYTEAKPEAFRLQFSRNTYCGPWTGKLDETIAQASAPFFKCEVFDSIPPVTAHK
jgi:hypothetical protein